MLALVMKALNRNYEPVHYTLLSLAIGALLVHVFDSIYTESDIAATASTAKSMAKKIQGNSLYQIKPETNKKQAV